MTSPVFVAVPSTADLAAVRMLSPLAADLLMQCGPFDVPVAVIASPASLEAETSEEARVARQFIEDDPWAGMGSVHAAGWMLLARDADTIVIGQRRGDVGLRPVVTLARRDGGFEALSMAGWQLRSADRHEQVEASFVGTAHGTTVTVEWDCGQDLAGVPERVVSRCEVLESDTEVHFLLFSIANPSKRPACGFQAGTGMSATATLELSQPLGSRTLFNDFRIPALRMELTPRNPSATAPRQSSR